MSTISSLSSPMPITPYITDEGRSLQRPALIQIIKNPISKLSYFAMRPFMYSMEMLFIATSFCSVTRTSLNFSV